MRHNPRLIFVLILAILLMPIISFAQTADNLPLDSRNHHGEVSIKNVKVIEKDYYKVIILDVRFKVTNLQLEDIVSIYPDSIKLVNEKGKTYFPNRDECNLPEPLVKVPDGGPCYEVKNECAKPVWSFDIKGTEGGIGQYHPCFRVEKEFTDFKAYYGYQQFGKSLSDSNLIGNIDLNKSPQQPASNIKIPTATQTKDFFSQFFDIIKKLFNFS